MFREGKPSDSRPSQLLYITMQSPDSVSSLVEKNYLEFQGRRMKLFFANPMRPQTPRKELPPPEPNTDVYVRFGKIAPADIAKRCAV